MPSARPLARSLLCAVTATLALAGCSSAPAAAPPPTRAASPAGTPTPPPAPAPTTPACEPHGWDCSWAPKFAAVEARVKASPGQLGVEVRDRQSGAVWKAGATDKTTWTGSTIKLAMVTSVFERARAGKVTLAAADRKDIADMLAWSSDDAADRIWKKFGRDSMVPGFRDTYGMKGLTFVAGFDRYWGFMKCGPDDLANLMAYVLGTLNGEDRAYIVDAMRHVQDIQHWGVWAVGATQGAGTKNGWSQEKDGGVEHWVTSTVGFAGPAERYVVTVMYSMPAGQDSLALGVHTVSDIPAALFGLNTPAPVVVRPS
ncbi:hypothetical protein Lfu02_53960 [Longispora fulva]|uniref:Beta-lactamase class A n=1 Tax=Longispora fulva TaxID=619741 RepID=A0A8J7KTG4_9ACTN|nr:hypothetical protein [Longispora fulva]MBG6140712.1 hypothetical protein [Longispora fulva]GIG61024.1 hypothetical protein Lfu02_53960 [Longispora fulva]